MDRRFEGRRWPVAFGALACAVLLVCVGGALGVPALFAASAPSFAAARSYATGQHPQTVAIGDLNGDGEPDLVTESGLNAVSVLLNRGDGSFQAKLDYGTGHNPMSVAISDLNSDAKQDLVTVNYSNPSGTVSVLINSGDGSFQAERDYPTGAGPHSVAIGDLNGDGKPDLVTGSDSAHTVSVLLNKGDGSFQPKLDYGTRHIPYSVAIGDLNGDGKPDVATANFDNSDYWSTVSVLLNRGNGTFRARTDYRTGTGAWEVAIGDLNGDGKPDVATATAGPSAVSVFLNRGDGRFRAKLDHGVGRSPLSIAIGDLNGDSKPDLATANMSSSTVSVLLNTPGLCTVQSVRRKTLPTARRAIVRANCRVGKIRRAYSKTVRTGRVISQKPGFGAVLRGGGKVDLVVSRGGR